MIGSLGGQWLAIVSPTTLGGYLMAESDHRHSFDQTRLLLQDGDAARKAGEGV